LAAVLFVAAPCAQADPKVDYLLHCSGCHMPDGSGLAPVVPTLHDVIGRMLAKPEGRSYIVRVPGVAQAPLDDSKLTEVLNWMLTEFSSATLPEDFEPLTVAEVARARSELLADPLKFRAKYWPGY
jgi:mono/diheme cytochrome c family protein